MRTWLITDTHFGHAKMIEYCGRPQGFEEIILKNLQTYVKPTDILIHLGDFCIGSDAAWHSRFMAALPGTKKWLIRGNHDKKTNSWYVTHGWDFVGTLLLDDCFGLKVLFSHIPIKSNDSWQLNIHGHFHNSDHRSQESELRSLYTERHLLLAIEHTKYQPVLLDKFLADSRKAIINKKEINSMSEDTNTTAEETTSTETSTEETKTEETKTEETAA